jgi:uncharacterized protein YjbI with pentapeptide repeats
MNDHDRTLKPWRAVILLLLLPALLSMGCGDDGEELVVERPFLYEADFALDSTLRAKPEHVVLLDLRPAGAMTSVEHSIPYHYAKRGSYTFCIPDDEPYITGLDIVDAAGQTVASVSRGSGCTPVTLEAGKYTQIVRHDPTDVPPQGTVAFLHRQQGQQHEVEAESSLLPVFPVYGVLEAAGGPHAGEYLTVQSYRIAFGNVVKFLEVAGIDDTAPFDALDHLFSFEPSGGSGASITYDVHSPSLTTSEPFSYLPLDCKADPFFCVSSQNPFNGNAILPCFDDVLPKQVVQADDIGNNQFTLSAEFYPVSFLSTFYAAENSLLYLTSFAKTATSDTPFQQVPGIRFYTDGSQVGALAQGEVAYFSQPNYSGNAFVLGTSLDLATLARLPQVASVRLGHDTTLQFFGQPGYQQLLTTIGVDTPSLANPISRASLGSIKIFQSSVVLLSTRRCESCNLAGVDLSNKSLDAVDLAKANLALAFLDNSSLKQADLRHALLHGSNFNSANLEGANLCGAFLNGTALSNNTAATFVGAYLKNASLAGANMSGAHFDNASFHTGVASACSPQNCAFTTDCASAVGATMDSAVFTGAYLAGVDMSGSDALNANFASAILDGVRFDEANLARDPTNTSPTDFSGAFIGGTDFTNATVTAAIFPDAYVDFSENGNCMYYSLPGSHTHFAGFWGNPGDPVCVLFAYSGPTITPATDSSNTCPNDRPGPCSAGVWQQPEQPWSDTFASRGCEETPVCSDIDFNW